MEPQEILQILNTEAPDIQWQVNGDGYQYQVDAVGECFEGLNAVKRQQLVYALLNPMILDGRLHAVTIRAFTPSEQS